VTIKVAVQHQTSYQFARPVGVGPHEVRLRPAAHTRTRVEAYSLTVEPTSAFVNWQQDIYGNYLARLVFPEPTDQLRITVDLIADMTAVNPFDFFVEGFAERMPFSYPDQLQEDLAPYLRDVDVEAVDEWIAARIAPLNLLDGTTRTVDFLVEVNKAVNAAIEYSTRMEAGVQSPAETLERRSGSCRDSAWLLVAILRRFGLAARFVSGYLINLAEDDRPGSTDFTDLHAWAEVFIPGAGWLGLDATSGLVTAEGHIPLSATPEPSASAPIKGATEAVDVEFSFHNQIRRIVDEARPSMPISDEQWTKVNALGQQIDQQLEAADVRVTVGGEPTFVAADGPDKLEWQVGADGDDKRSRALQLAQRLRAHYAPGGIIQLGQGKWYPGEDQPRWQLLLSWRRDQAALWQRQELLADPWTSGSTTPAQAAELAREIASQLGFDDDLVVLAYEDAVGQALRAGQLPEASPQTTSSPRTLLADFDRQLDDEPAGWVLPLFLDPDADRSDPRPPWASTHWRTRRERLHLIAGDGPLGSRLPLNSVAAGVAPSWLLNADRDAERRLPRLDELYPRQARVIEVEDAPRTAISVELRDGRPHIYLPPIDRLDDAVELLAAVERAVTKVGEPVVLEGYGLPVDDRLASLSVTPDPGVIEVNAHPVASWAEQVELTESLYAQAAELGLVAERFDLDGRHSTTGGGNHITLGGPSVPDSPLLRRPDLLVSLLTYWQQHPGLSYVFSGKFVGPTSQAPRVDESRPDNLHELEVAFQQLLAMTDDPQIDHDIAAQLAADMNWDETEAQRVDRQRRSQPWLTDRLLRNLLTDVTGNTHRSEFCIDKLYNPAMRSGRLGLLELRGFEMPPHPRMALLQGLLVRALVLRFWLEPLHAPLVRWGTRLHDQFLLPAFAADDLRRVIVETNSALARHGVTVDFDPAWFEVFVDFRFPKLGSCTVDGVELELRQAIEPWQVLGEDMTSGGTARYVDSSCERVQISAHGLIDGRHQLVCNGHPVPLTPSPSLNWSSSSQGDANQLVGGVRFKAWTPPSGLHPTIGVHSPLAFDLVDSRTGESLGGLRYHVTDPGGAFHERYPMNAAEAEARRAARFEASQSSGRVEILNGGGSPEFPTTLDLRRVDQGRPIPRQSKPVPEDFGSRPGDLDLVDQP